jgi:AraC-like DNA-binding protein
MDNKSIDDISPRFRNGGWAVMLKGTQCSVMERIPDHDIQFAYQGAGTVVIDGVEYHMQRGDILTVFPGESFYETVPQDSTFARYFLHFDFFSHPDERKITPVVNSAHRWPRLVHLENDVAAREICSDIIMLYKLRESDPLHSDLYKSQKSGPLQHILSGKMHSLLGIILAQYLEMSIDVTQNRLKSRRNIFKVERYIKENYTNDINVEQLAEMADLSLCYFVTVFKTVIGKSPKDYLIDCRIEQAKQLLIETEHNVTEVAALVGYDDASYFSNLFKQREGVSPSEFAVKFSTDEKYTG